MMEAWFKDRIFFIEKWLENPSICIECCSIQNGIVGLIERSNFRFQLLMNVLGTTNKAHRRHAETMGIDGAFSGFHHARMRAQTQVVVGAEIDNFLSASNGNIGSLRASNDSFFFVQTGFFNFFQLCL